MTIKWSFSYYYSFVKSPDKKFGSHNMTAFYPNYVLMKCVIKGLPCICFDLIWFDLILYVPSTIFQLNRVDYYSWVEPVLS